LSSVLLFSYPLLAEGAQASPANQPGDDTGTVFRDTAVGASTSADSEMYRSHGKRGAHVYANRRNRPAYVAHAYRISCVPYARQVSGIMVVGNAWQWWNRAEGMYARGDQPEPGAVLNFRSNGRMRLGHVAVVTRIVNPREIMIDQANWPSAASNRGGISHNVAVVDVSEANNWSAVRVQLGRGEDFGSVYPTYGFIYNRPDTGFVTATVARPTPQAEINRVPSDLRPVAERPWRTVEEVAEASAGAPRRIDLRFTAADPTR
jgi:surface antigen